MEQGTTNTSPPKVLRSRCRDCGVLTPITELNYLYRMNSSVEGSRLDKSERVCDACLSDYSQCEYCNTFLDTAYEDTFDIYDRGETMLCSHCAEEHLIRCSDCDTWYHVNDYIDCPNCDHDDEDEDEHEDGMEYPHDLMRRTNVAEGKKTYGACRKSGTSIKSPRMFGVELEMVVTNNDNREVVKAHSLVNDIVPKYWGVTTDASLPSNSLEVQTAPMAMEEGEKTLKQFLDEINSSGLWNVTDRCGTHVHLDCADIIGSFSKIRKVMAAFFVLDDVLLATQPRGRRSNRYCSPLSKEKAVRNRDSGFEKGFSMAEILALQNTSELLHTYYKASGSRLVERMSSHYNEARYYGINFHTLFDGRGTIENRYHEGTLNHEEIVNWIAFNQHIIDTSRLMTNDVCARLYEIKNPMNRLLEYGKITGLDSKLISFYIARIIKYK